VTVFASELPVWFVLLVAGVFGAIWGSFFNVAIYRWPRDMSVVRPASHCPHCGVGIAARHNVPILGFLWLRGHAACCGRPLSPRYPVVELLSAVLCLAIVRRFVLDAADHVMLSHALMSALAYFFFVGGLLIASFVDLEFMEIPDEVSLPGAALGLTTAVFRDQPGAEAALLGAGGGYLVIQVVFVWTYEHLTGRRGMGEGDSKLVMMIGAFLGWQGAVFAVFAGAAQGLLAFVLARVTGLFAEPADSPPVSEAAGTGAGVVAEPTQTASLSMQSGVDAGAQLDEDDDPEPAYWGHAKLPFGPFLALGALEYLFFSESLLSVWSRLVEA